VFGIFVVSKYISYADVIGKLCLKRKNATVIAEKALVQKNPPRSPFIKGGRRRVAGEIGPSMSPFL
jgi:hypothetical protein